MTVRAKFICNGVEKTHRGTDAEGNSRGFLYNAKLSAVYQGAEGSENKKFWESTPAGQITLNSILEEAFAPGAEYYIDFTPAG